MTLMRIGQCINCFEEKLVGPLHLEKGGPDFCLPCGTEWHAKQERERKESKRIYQAMLGSLGGTSYAGPHELTLELLEEAVRLTHPDRHPDRVEQATRVTAELLALKPYVFPKPQSNASVTGTERTFRLSVTPPPPTEGPRNGYETSHPCEVAEPYYPCEICRRTVPYYYCSACEEQWKTRRREERERTNAQQRKRRAWYRQRRPPVRCAVCGTDFKGKRKDARYCSAACRQRAHRSCRGAHTKGPREPPQGTLRT